MLLCALLAVSSGCGGFGGSGGLPQAARSTAPASTAAPGATAPLCNKVVVETDGLTLALGGIGQQLQASGYFTDGRVRDLTHLVTWSVSDPSVAAIDSQGYLWPIAAGSVSVQATCSNVRASGTLTVTAAAAGATPANLGAAIGALPPPDQLVVKVKDTGELLINAEKVPEAEYVDRLRGELARKPANDKIVFVLADDKASYARVVAACDGAKQAGAETLGMATELAPEDPKK